MKKDEKFYLRLICSNLKSNGKKCKNELLTSKEMTKQEINDRWISMVISKGFNTPKCNKCNYSTFSDLNIGTDMTICKVGSKRALNTRKFLG